MTTQPHPNPTPLPHTVTPTAGRATPSAQGATHAATHLRAGQTRVIHASEGLTLHVLQGRLWLTQPGDPADHFLCAGESLELAQDWVVVEADAAPRAPQGQPEPVTAYRLAPQHTRSRPVVLAWYRAASARASSDTTVSPSWAQATPALVVTGRPHGNVC